MDRDKFISDDSHTYTLKIPTTNDHKVVKYVELSDETINKIAEAVCKKFKEEYANDR